MAEEALQTDVAAVETETTPESSPEIEQPIIDDSAIETPTIDEPVDEAGVPLKNRVAEQERKLKSKVSKLEAQNQLLSGSVETPRTPVDNAEAIQIVESIAEQKVLKRMEPLLVKQFLSENPDALEIIDDINAVRKAHPQLAGIEQLDLAYKIAKSERSDQAIIRAEEKGRQETTQVLEKQKQGAIQGTGKVKAPSENLDDKLKNASSLKDLEALEQYLS